MSKLTATDFYKPTKYNPETLNQIWMSEIADSHDIWCDCCGPFAHLLASIFPPGHTDRNLTINQILKRDYQQCRSGGREETRDGSGKGLDTGDTTDIKAEEEDFPEEELNALLDAAKEEDTPR